MPFIVTVSVYNQNKLLLIDTRNNPNAYIAHIWLTNNSTELTSNNLVGNTTISSINGTATFSNLSITDVGSYIIFANVSQSGTTGNKSIQSAQSSVFTTIWVVSSISARTAVGNVSCYFYYSITVYLIWNNVKVTYYGEAAVELTDNDNSINGNTSGIITKGSKVFTVFFNSPGNKTINITTTSPSIISTTISVNVLPSNFTMSIPISVWYI